MKHSLLLKLLVLTLTGSASAHHSFAMYDSSRLIALEGQVTKFQWTNPHALIWVSATARELPAAAASAEPHGSSTNASSAPPPPSAPSPASPASAPGVTQPVAATQPAAASAGENLWILELPTSPGNLARMGWSKHSVKPGDRVIVEINPLRDGSRGGSFKKVTLLASGKTLLAKPTSIGADGTPYFGPNEAPVAGKAPPSATNHWWSCSFGSAPTTSTLGPSIGLVALALIGLRRRQSR